ncbi:MAG: PEP-utilizing enzyme [Actinomycetota bacterium]|nr:PEP-utilizing enzyme [Actinomycetota bacterium]
MASEHGRSSQRMLMGVATSPGVGIGRLVHHSERGDDAGDRVEDQVVVAAELRPADVTALDVEGVRAVATVAGAPLSHGSILLRSLGIPAVTGLGREVLDLPSETLVLVDGDAGTVQVEPEAAAVEEGRARQRAARAHQDEARRLGSAPALTRDGRAIPVVVNVGNPEDAELAVREGADGVGMLRTEFVFLDRREPPGEEEQYAAYREVSDAIGDRPLVIRTLDLGADIPAWDAPPEPNPALGNRGLRFALSSPELLETQLRAVLRLARERPVGVMFPMVTTVEEVRQARRYLDAADVAIEVGITVEVPAAALTAHAFVPLLDFFAVGTNDLTQYTLAVDRANAAVAAIADGLHPAVLRLIGEVCRAGEDDRLPVCIVGELGCEPLAIPVLLGLGVASLSVRPNAVATVKQAVRRVAVEEARELAGAAVRAESAAAVRETAAQHAPER